MSLCKKSMLRDSIVKSIILPYEPLSIKISPTGNAYITYVESKLISVIDTKTNTLIDSNITTNIQPNSLSFSPDGKILYVVNRSISNSDDPNGYISVIDITKNIIIDTIVVDKYPGGISIASNGSYGYITHSNGNTISILDIKTNTIDRTKLYLGTTPVGVATSPDGTLVYFSDFGGNSIIIFDSKKNSVIKTINVESIPIGVALTPNSSYLYFTNYLNSSISIISTKTNSIIGTPIYSPPLPFDIAISNDGKFAYVISHNSTSVAIIDISNNSYIKNC